MAIPKLLELLSLKGCIVTIDAMGCQTDIARQIVDNQADYVLAPKENQGYLYQDIAALFDQCAGRAHWCIENSLHRVLDVAFQEDQQRARYGDSPQNFAVLRHIALSLLKHETFVKQGIKGKRLRAGWSNAYLLKVLGI